MATITLYHNPRCSKSRQAQALLQASGKAYTTVEYLKQPLDSTQLHTLLQQCQCAPSDLIRHQEADFKSANLHQHACLTAEQVVQAIVRHPKLMQRPIVAAAGNAVIARPPEKLLALL